MYGISGSENSFCRKFVTNRADDFCEELDDKEVLDLRIFDGKTSDSRRRRREANNCFTAGGLRDSWESEQLLERKNYVVQYI